MKPTGAPSRVALGVVVILLALASTVVVAAAQGGFGGRHEANIAGRSHRNSCVPSDLGSTVVDVTLLDMGRAMTGGNAGPMMGGAAVTGRMGLRASRDSVPTGAVSFVATNAGSLVHELVVLPLAAGAVAGARVVGDDGTVDEATSLGEASSPCGPGGGDGITPGTSSWLTVTLAPGRYELVCNVPGHYAAGMYTLLTVTS